MNQPWFWKIMHTLPTSQKGSQPVQSPDWRDREEMPGPYYSSSTHLQPPVDSSWDCQWACCVSVDGVSQSAGADTSRRHTPSIRNKGLQVPLGDACWVTHARVWIPRTHTKASWIWWLACDARVCEVGTGTLSNKLPSQTGWSGWLSKDLASTYKVERDQGRYLMSALGLHMQTQMHIHT